MRRGCLTLQLTSPGEEKFFYWLLTTVYCLLLLNFEHELAELRARLHEFVRAPGVGERERPVYDSANLPALDELQGVEQFGLRPHERAEQVEVAVEDLSQVRARVVAARRAARDEPPVLLQGHNRACPRRRARVLEDDINALLARKTPHLLRPVLARVVDDLIRAERARLPQLLLRACGRDDARTAQARYLNPD